MRWLALAALFVFAFLVFAAASAPLSPILRLSGAPAQGVAWVAASGTIWRGEVVGVRIGDQDIGDLTIDADPWSLLGLGLKSAVRTRGPVTVRAELRAGLDGAVTIEDATLTIDVARWRGVRADLARSGGEVFVSIRRLVIDRSGACREAQGAARTDVLVRAAAAAQPEAWIAPSLEGPLRCEAGVLTLALAGEAAAGSISASLQVDGAKQSAVLAAEARSEVRGAALSLGLLGFVEVEPGRFTFDSAVGG